VLAAAALPAARRLADRRPRLALATILLFGALFRLLLVPAGLSPGARLADDLSGRRLAFDSLLLYDNDVWRYLWDGHLAAHGLDPYARSPAEVGELAFDEVPPYDALFSDGRWWDVWDSMSFRTYTSVYPPAAQALFRLAHALAPGSVVAWKLLVVALDLVTCLLLAGLLHRLGRSPAELLLYAWNPLAIKELAGSGHVDALAVLLVTATVLALLRRRPVAGMLAYAGAILAKLSPLVAVGPLLRRVPRRWWAVLPVALVAGLLPYAGGLDELAAGLAVFGRQWVFNAGPWALLAWIARQAGAADPAAVARLASAVVVAAVALAVTLYHRRQPPEALPAAVFAILATLVVMSPAVMPWYLLWPLPLAVAAGIRSWWLFTALAPLSYLVYAYQAEHSVWLWLEYLPFLIAAGAEWRHRRRGAAPIA
jgi:hypothetical protein